MVRAIVTPVRLAPLIAGRLPLSFVASRVVQAPVVGGLAELALVEQIEVLVLVGGVKVAMVPPSCTCVVS